MDYKLIQATDKDALADRVQAACAEGYAPQGGVSVVITQYHPLTAYLYTQAMTRESAQPTITANGFWPIATSLRRSTDWWKCVISPTT